MAANITKIKKKLDSLYNSKTKEEEKFKAFYDKAEAKYKDDVRTLKEAFDLKVSNEKEKSGVKLSELKQEIDFYEKQMAQIEKLNAQIAELDKETEERLSAS